tara:strand:+ start:2153 stop:2542 length:390 start_codon:yes stop_codon:yes gene_type:complete
MNRSQFSKTANAAINEGRIARKALAEHNAKSFVSGASEFDPRALTKLGSAGMRRFIEIVQASGTPIDHPPENSHEQAATPSPDPGKTTYGWAAQQCAEPNWGIRAVLYGIFTGSAVFLCGIAVLATLPL